MVSRSALLIIDVQTGLVAGDDPVHDLEPLLANIGVLLSRARARGVPVVYVQDDDVAEVGSPAWEVHPAICPEPGDVRVRKPACDSFHETELHDRLRERGVEHLVVAGCKTEFCIDTTCRRAVTLGYGVTLAGDAHSTSGNRELAAPAIIDHHNRVLSGFGALVAGRPCEIRVLAAVDIEL